MATFFISYSREDLPDAEELRKHIQLLDSANEVFMDLHKIKVGVRWNDALLNAIRQSSYFILILSRHSANSKYVRQEVSWVLQDELKTGVRKLFVYRIDNVPIPEYLSSFQVLTTTGNFTVDFYKLFEGIRGKASFFSVQHERHSDEEAGYWVKLFIEAPPQYLKMIDWVEYRFDWEFLESEYVHAVETVENKGSAIKKKFAVEFWTGEPILVFVVLYLKTMRQITFEHQVPIYE